MKLARLAVALTAIAAFTACSDDPEPKVEPSESGSSPTSPASAPTTARELEREFIAHYVQQISDALSSGDASGFLDLSDPECANCTTLAENLEEAYRDGGHIVGGSWAVESASYVEVSELGSIWNVDIRSTRERWLARDGSEVKVVPEGLQLLGLAISKDGPDLQVQALRIRT